MSTPSWRFWPSLAGLPRNARNALRTEPLWAIFGTVVAYYAPLYMREVGLSSTQVGWLGSITLAFSFVFQLLAAPVTNRVGRRRTTLIGDLISWTVPMFVWAFAHNFTAFVVAAVLSASGRIVVVSWSLLVIEDVPQDSRSRVFGILTLINAACGLLTPLLGLFMTHYGALPTLRAYYLLGGVGMTVMFLWRNAITEETQRGQQAILEHRELHPWQSLTQAFVKLWPPSRYPGLPGMMVFYVLSIFVEQMNVFQILYFSETLHFGAAVLSVVPVATAVVGILMYSLVLRRLSGQSAERLLVLARVLGLAGAVALLLIPAGQLGGLLLVVGVLAAASFLTLTYRESALFHYIPGASSADLYSAVQTLSLVASVPAGVLAGALFHVQPRLLFWVIAALNVALLALAGLLAVRRQSAGPNDPSGPCRPFPDQLRPIVKVLPRAHVYR